MGASQFPTGIQPIPNLSQWEEFNVNKTSQQVKQINYVTFRNKYSGLLIDRYEVDLKNADEQKIYKYQISQRSRDRCIVEVLFYCHETYSEFCINTHKAYVYIQHMPTRLKNIRQVTVEEAVYIFSSALQGISRLYDQKGYFQLKQNHFCFNRQGELKVWMNQDLSLNYPQDVGLNSKQRSESSIVAKLIQLISKNLVSKQSVCSFQQYINARNIKVLSFEHAKRLLKCYCTDLQLIVPPRCDSLSNKCPRERSKVKQYITKTNLSSIKARIKGACLKNERKESIKIITKPLPIYKPLPNQRLNQSMEQSKMVKILWQSAHKKPTSQLPSSVVTHLHERKTTLADGLLSQSSVSCSTRSASRLPSRGFSLSFQQGSCTFGSKRKLNDPKQNQKLVNKLNELTTDNTPRDIIIAEKKCKYSTTDISMEVDPSIAEDLRRYL